LQDTKQCEAIYPLGRSRAETERLQQQSQFYNVFTRRLFEDAGLGRGMKVLDVGCGAGDVSLLVAGLVGPQGSVLGVDLDAGVIETARRRSHEARLNNVSFVAGDINSVPLEQDFDAVVGRLVLMYFSEPAGTLLGLVSHLRSGGIVAFQEADWTNKPLALPESPCAGQIYDWMVGCFQKAGVETQMGLKLNRVFLAAGLPEPHLRLEAPLGGGPAWQGYAYTENSIRNMLPLLIRFNVATADEVDIDNLAARLRAEVVSQNGVVMLSPFVSAWTVKP
jgi:SAM-dependent methyltransferase